VEVVESLGGEAPLDRARLKSELQQLPSRRDPVLGFGQQRDSQTDRRSLSPNSGY
jgi:hypothetical protein